MRSSEKIRKMVLGIVLAITFTMAVVPTAVENGQTMALFETQEEINKHASEIQETAQTLTEEVVEPVTQLDESFSSTPVWGEEAEKQVTDNFQIETDSDQLIENHSLMRDAKQSVLEDKIIPGENMSDREYYEYYKDRGFPHRSDENTLDVSQLDNNNPTPLGGQKRFFTGSGYNLDQYLYHGGGPIQFNIYVDIDVDTSDPEAFARLTLRVYDVDMQGAEGCGPEVDQVYFNDQLIGTLTGANNQWSTNEFQLNPSWVVKGPNTVKVIIDVATPGRGSECWATEVDYGEITLPFTDVGLSQSDISLDPKDGSSDVDVEATIHNYGTKDVQSVLVHVFDVNPETGSATKIHEQTIPSINAGSTQKVSLVWSNAVKEHKIRVVVDPGNTIAEADEENNHAEKKYTDLVVENVIEQFKWVFFISTLFPLENKYTATVDSVSPVERVEFTFKESNKKIVDSSSGDGWSATFKMHEDLVDGWNTLEVIAFDEDGKSSDPFTVRVYGVEIPDWLSFIINTWNYYQELVRIAGGSLDAGSPLKVDKNEAEHKVTYKIDLAYKAEAWIPIPVFPILHIGVTFQAYFKMDLDSQGAVTITGGGKLGIGLKVSITELVKKVPSFLKKVLDLVGTDEIKRTLEYVIEVSGTAKFGVGGLTSFKLDLKIGMEDTRSATLMVLNTGLSFTFFLGIYVVFHIYDSDFDGNKQGWRDRVELEIKPEISIKGSLALGSLTGYAWELKIAQDYYLKIVGARGTVALTLTTTDYNLWEPDTTTTDTLIGPYTFNSGQILPAAAYDLLMEEVPLATELSTAVGRSAFPAVTARTKSSAMMIWTEYTPGATTPAGYNLYYSHWNGYSWSSKSLLENSAYPDFQPVVQYLSSGEAVAVWQRFNDTSIVNSTTHLSVANSTQLYWSKYTGSSWTTPESLTNVAVHKTGLVLERDNSGSQLILNWLEDADGNLTTFNDVDGKVMMFNSSTNSWSGSSTIFSGSSVVGKVGISYNGSTAIATWTSDNDGDLFTVDDQEIKTSVFDGSSWSSSSTLTSNTVADLTPTTIFDGEGIPRIFWIGYPFVSTNVNETVPTVYESRLSSTGWTTPTVVFEPDYEDGNISFVPQFLEVTRESNDNLFLVMGGLFNNSLSTGVAFLFQENGSTTWGAKPIPLTNFETDAVHFSSSGSLVDQALFVGFANDVTPVNTTFPAQNTTVQQVSTNLKVVRQLVNYDLGIGYGDVWFEGDRNKGSTVTVHARVRNTGISPSGIFDVRVYQDYASYDPNKLYNATVGSLTHGETFDFSFSWTIPTSYDYAELYFLVNYDNRYSEANSTNNYLFLAGYSTDPFIVSESLTYDRGTKKLEFQLDANMAGKVSTNIQLYRGGPPGYGGQLVDSQSLTMYSGVYTRSFLNIEVTNDSTIFFVLLTLSNSYFDTNLSNNVAFLSYSLLPEMSVSPYSLVLTSTYQESQNNLTLGFTIQNNGFINASSHQVHVYELGSGTETLVDNLSVPVIMPGQRLQLFSRWTGTDGLKTIRVIVDPTSATLDGDRGNNNLTMVLYIQPAPPAVVTAVNGVNAEDFGGGLLNDTFVANLTIHAYVPGDYRLRGMLLEPSGRYMPGIRDVTLVVGENNILLNFSAYQFGRAEVSGSVSLVHLNFLNLSTGVEMVRFLDLFTSSSFDVAHFDKSPVLTAEVNQATVSYPLLDSSGRVKVLEVTLPIYSYIDENLFIGGIFRLTDGSVVSQNVEVFASGYYTSSVNALKIRFSGEDFYYASSSGPFVLSELIILNGSVVVAYSKPDLPIYLSSKAFLPRPVELTGVFNDIAVDTDADGLYNTLRFSLEVVVGWTDTFYFNGKVFTLEGTPLGVAQSSFSLNPGSHTIDLDFDGQEVWGALHDGPYVIDDISIYPESDTDRIVQMESPYNTSSYSYTDFEAGAVIRGQVFRTTGSQNSNVLYYEGAQNIFAVSNSTGHYHLTVKTDGDYTVHYNDPSLEFFIHLNGKMVANGSNYQVDIKLGQIIELDWHEPFRVDPSGDYPTIQSAINNASSGDYITVPNLHTTFSGGVEVNKSLSLIGRRGSGFPVINATNNSFGIKVTSSNVLLHGFVILNSSGPGLWVSGVSNVNFTRITTINNSYGIQLNSVTGGNLWLNVMVNNSVNAFDDGDNSWDSGIIGNYYSDYGGTDSDGDSVGESTYFIAGGSAVDTRPRVNPDERDNVFVDELGRGDFSDVQWAISYANDDATIRVMPGTYQTKVLTSKQLTIFGTGGKDQTIIQTTDISGTRTVFEFLSSIYLHNVTIQGNLIFSGDNTTVADVDVYGSVKAQSLDNYTFRNSRVWSSMVTYDLVMVQSSTNYVIDSVLVTGVVWVSNGYEQTADRALYITSSENGTLSNLIINGTFSTNVFYLYSSENTIVKDSTAILRRQGSNYGINLNYAINTTVQNVTFGAVYQGVRVSYGSNNTFVNNSFYRTQYGINVYSTTGLVFKCNLFRNVSSALFSISYGTQVNFTSNTFEQYSPTSNSFSSSTIDWAFGGVGNYWSLYGGQDSNSDGVGDTPYQIHASPLQEDPLPLMNPVCHLTQDSLPPTVAPQANLEVDEDTVILLNASGSTDNVAILEYEWDVENKGKYYGEQVTIVFAYPGLYRIVLTVFDLSSNTASTEFNVTVRDVTPPTVYLTTTPQKITPGTLYNYTLYSYNIADDSLINTSSYLWWFMYDGSLVTIPNLRLSYQFDIVGQYMVYFNVSDIHGNVGTKSLIIEVDYWPVIFNALDPYNSSTITGSGVIYWSFQFDNGTSLVAWDGGSNHTAYWHSYYSKFYISATGLGEGWHKLSIYTFDTLGRSYGYSYWFYVDITPPEVTIVSPTTNNTLLGSNWVFIEWDISTNRGDFSYLYLYLDGYSWTYSYLSQGSYNFTNLAVGSHTIEIRAYDDIGNIGRAWLVVEVPLATDLTNPDVTSFGNTTIFYGVVGSTVNWVVGDVNPDTYRIYVDGSLEEEGSWSNGTITYSLNVLSEGLHNLTIIVYDQTGHTTTSTIWVNVIVDSTDPSVDQPVDMVVENDMSSIDVTWNVNDLSPSTYSVFVNDSLVVDAMSWTNGTISYSLTTTVLGIFNVSILLRDTSGNRAFDTVWVTIQDTTPPEVSGVASLSVEQGDNENLSYVATDHAPATYVLFLDGVEVMNGEWDSGVAITYELSGLAVGTYNITIVFTDQAGNTVGKTTIVTVTSSGGNTTTTSTETTTTSSSGISSSTDTDTTGSDTSGQSVTSSPGFSWIGSLLLASIGSFVTIVRRRGRKD